MILAKKKASPSAWACPCFCKTHSCLQHSEFKVKGDDGFQSWGKVVGNASQKHLVFWTVRWAGEEIRGEMYLLDQPCQYAPELSLWQMPALLWEPAGTAALLPVARVVYFLVCYICTSLVVVSNYKSCCIPVTREQALLFPTCLPLPLPH